MENQTTSLIIIATGGTGGHIFPALALKKTLEAHGSQVKITADAKFAKYHDFNEDHILIPAANLSSRSISKLFFSLCSLAHGFLKALWFIYQQNPDIVIGFGGYASYPTMLAAIVLGKKIILHEANTVIGKVNKILLWRAKYLTTGFKTIYGIETKDQPKVIYTGNPVRSEILNKPINRDSDKLSILVIGGSQGAKIFSKIIPDALINLPTEVKAKLHICQQVKEEDVELIRARYTAEGISCEIKSFFDDMDKKLSCANLLIARSGASTIAEVIETKLPAILIPLPSSADNHQFYNAKEMDDLGAAWLVIEDGNAQASLLKLIKSIVKTPAKLETRSNKLKNLKQDACENIVRVVESVIHS